MDTFTRQYIATALWSSSDDEEEPLDSNYGVEDIAPETLKEMIEDCADFQAKNMDDIVSDLEQAGHDFWLTRNGHGAGFWDGGWPKPTADRLTANSKAYGEYSLYVGDDGLIYGT